MQKNKRNVAKKKGGQPGNKNAEGHGGTGPPGNKNAVRTGEFETLFFDTLEPEERTLAEMIRPDKEQLLLREIQLLAVRERRMLKRIQSLRELEAQTGSEEDSVPCGMSVTEYTSGIEKGKQTELRKYEGILGQLQAIEDALTRVQARQQKAREMLHKFGYDDAKLELATIKEFASYIWDEKALERGEDKPVKQFDHCCDAVRYLCSTIIGRKAARFREIRRKPLKSRYTMR